MKGEGKVYSTYHLIRCSSPSTSGSGRLHTHRTCPWLGLCVGEGVAEIVDELLRWPGVNRCRCPLPDDATWAGTPGRLLVPACITFLSSAAASPRLPPVDGRVVGGGGASCWSISIWSTRLVAGPFRGFRRNEVEEKELRSLTERCRRFCDMLLTAVGGLDMEELELRGGSGKLKDVLRLGMIMGSSSDDEENSSSSRSGLTGGPAQELRWLPDWLVLGKTGSRSSSSSTTVSVRARPSSPMTNLTDANFALLCRACCVRMVFSGIDMRLDNRW